jgi:hypothetical protein
MLCATQRLCQRRTQLILNVPQYDPCTLLDEGFGRRSANTACRASNDGYFVCQSLIHCCFLYRVIRYQFSLLPFTPLFTASHLLQ